MISNQKIDQAIRQLNIRTNNSVADKQQLSKIIFQILRFPLISQANIHQMANKLGQTDLKRNKKELQNQIKSSAKNIQQLKVCQCCGLLQQKQKLSCCQDLDNVDLGVGVRLYFLSIAHHAIILTLAFILYAIYALITNGIASYNNNILVDNVLCLFSQSCGLVSISLGAKLNSTNTNQTTNYTTLLLIQIIIGIIVIAIWGAINFARRHKQNQFQTQMEIQRVSASNFTLMIDNFPKIYLDKPYVQVLKQMKRIFADYAKKTNTIHTYQVVKVNIARPIYNQREQNKKRREDLTQELYNRQEIFRRWIQYRKTHNDFPVPADVRQQAYESYYKFFTEKYDKRQVHQCPLADKNLIFVTMRSSSARNEIAKQNQFFNTYCCGGKGFKEFPIQGVTIKPAPQPQQIMWENVGFGTCKKIIRVFIIYFISFILLAISFGISIGITFAGIDNQTNLAVVISIIITIINFALQYTIFLISFLENQKIKTAQQASIAFKISLSQILNSIGIPIALVYISKQKLMQSQNGTFDSYSAVYSNTGLVSSVFYIALFSLATPVGRFIDPYNIFVKLKKWYYSSVSKRFQMNGQAELNQYYSCYQMDLGYQYAYIIRTVIFTAFFMPLQPIIAIFPPVGLGLMYAVNKYKLYYRFDRPRFHDFHVNNLIDWILSLGPVALALGQLYAIIWIPSHTQTSSQVAAWIALGLAGLLYIFPMKLLYCCVQQPQQPNWDFLQKQAIIPSDYDRLNPSTKQQAINQLQHYFNEMQKKQGIPNYSAIVKMSVLNENRINQMHNNDMRMRGSFMRHNSNAPKYVTNLDSYDHLLKK